MKKRSVFLMLFFAVLTFAGWAQDEDAHFETATEAVKNMKIGWNLWNTLDSYGDWFQPEGWWSWETCWGNPITKPELMKMMRKAGFNSIRVPVTWFPHMDDDGNVDPSWMKRVHEVVDYVIDQGMYCILNVHHETVFDYDDEGNVRYAKLMADKDNYDENQWWFENLWRQIADEFKDYDEHLIFEGYNEMLDIYGSWMIPENADEAYQGINDYAQSFVNAVRSTGGKNKERNLVVNTYSACTGPGEDYAESFKQMKIPEDVTSNHIIFGIHDYVMNSESDVDGVISNVTKYISTRGIPTIISEWGGYKEYDNDFKDLDGYFIQQAKANNIATLLWGGMSSLSNRNLPIFDGIVNVKKLLKAYYGDSYEPQLLTIDDYDYQHTKVTFSGLWTQLRIYGTAFSLNDYKGIRLEMGTKPNDIDLLIHGDDKNKEQRERIASSSFKVNFNKSLLGSKVSGIELQNMKDSKNEITIYNAYLIKSDGTEEKLAKDKFADVWGCTHENIRSRKQFVHTIEYNGLLSELNLFFDVIPLKLKNYKGIRVELAEMPKDNAFSIKIYGDGEQKEDNIGLKGLSTTVMFNTDIFSQEINRVTLQYLESGKAETKIINVWLIRQDGTEEYSDLSIYKGCEITNVEEYVPEPITIIANDLSMTYGDEIPELTYTSEGPALVGTPKITCEATSSSPVGTYPIIISKGSVTNYNDSYVNGTLTIKKAPLSVGVKDATREQGQENPTFEITYNGWKLNETENVLTKKPTAKTSATEASPPGVYDITVSGAEAENYKISYTKGKLTITEADGILGISIELPVDVYDLQGNKVRSKITTLKDLPKGVYIINGRKVLVK